MFQNLKKTEYWLPALATLVTPVLLELLLHLFIYGKLGARIVYPVLFALSAGALLFGLCSLLPKKAGAPVLCVLLGLVTLYFEIHLVYNSIFGEFMSLMQLFTGGAAVTNFFDQMLYGIWQVLPQILAMLLPLAAVIVLSCMKLLRFPRWKWHRPLAACVLCVVLHFCAIGVMASAGTDAFSVYGLYTNRNTGTEISVNNLGLITTTRLECRYMLLPDGDADTPAEYIPQEKEELNDSTEYNVLDIDFAALSESRTDSVLKKLDAYFDAVTPTEKHGYTGLLEGYNLITICAESFSPLLIDPERTPTLHKLSTGGFIFENFFGTYGSNTTNGEYTFCMGNYPDMSRSKAAASFFASQANYLPFCLGNQLKEQGYQTWAYHNYSGEYYSRRDTHPNMGYTEFQAAGSGLDIEINWPSSDLEMMQASVADFLSSDQPFHAYYMTFSGHYQYDWENPMSLKNKAMAENLPYSETVQAYIACNNELEAALAYLMEQLEAAGQAEKTVIVLTNDHYPYGLTDAQYSELAGYAVDTVFEKFRNSFICYVPGMEPVTVDTYCSTADILPTILNLFGLPYDSRLLAGRDVLSDGASGMAVLADQSFVTKDYGFDAATGEVRVFTEGYTVDGADLLRRQNLISNQMQVSLDVLNYDYYRSTVAKHLLRPGEPAPEGSLQQPDPDPTQPQEKPALPFDDIPEGKSTDCLEFLIGNGYLEPASETKYGYSAKATYAEFLDVLYRMAGSPDMNTTWVYMGSYRTMTGKYLPAAKWAAHNGLLNVYPESMNSYRSLPRSDAAVTLMKLAASMGFSTEVDDEALLAEMAAEHPEFTADECRALHWCYNHLIIQGSGGKLRTVMDSDPTLNRYDMARVIYHFWLYVLQENT